jgi:hypothetical protein
MLVKRKNIKENIIKEYTKLSKLISGSNSESNTNKLIPSKKLKAGIGKRGIEDIDSQSLPSKKRKIDYAEQDINIASDDSKKSKLFAKFKRMFERNNNTLH